MDETTRQHALPPVLPTKNHISQTPIEVPTISFDDSNLRAQAKRNKVMAERGLKNRRRQQVLENIVKGKISNSRKQLPRNLIHSELESCQRRQKISNQPLVIDDLESERSR